MIRYSFRHCGSSERHSPSFRKESYFGLEDVAMKNEPRWLANLSEFILPCWWPSLSVAGRRKHFPFSLGIASQANIDPGYMTPGDRDGQ